MGFVRPKVDRLFVCRLTGALLFLALAACSTEEPSSVAEGTYVGKLDGSDAMFAVTVAGNDVVAYACGGPLTIHLHTRWYQGTLDGDSVELSSDDGATGTPTRRAGVSGLFRQAAKSSRCSNRADGQERLRRSRGRRGCQGA